MAGYGVFDFSPGAFGLFSAFWESHVKVEHLEEPILAQGIKNALIVLKIEPSAVPAGSLKVPNVIGSIYEKYQLPIFNVKDDKEKLKFFEDRLREWPNVSFFKQKVQQLRSK